MNPQAKKISDIQVSYKPKVAASDRHKICDSKSAWMAAISTWTDGELGLRESFKVLCLNNKNEILGCYVVALGGRTEAQVDPGVLFQIALVTNATRVILTHNHPSGDYTPSPSDIALTRRLVQGGELLNTPVLDHIIVTKGQGYASFRDLGLIK